MQRKTALKGIFLKINCKSTICQLLSCSMRNVILSLFVVFSLLSAPIAHASGVNCEGDNCQMTQKSETHSKSEKQDDGKQDDGKMAKAGHHCCCPHVSAMPNLTVATPMTVSSRTVFVLEQDATTSVVVGPPLKPPSHA